MLELQFWQGMGTGLFKLIAQMVIIVIPLMIAMEIMKDLNILDKLTNKLKWTVKPFEMSPGSVFPLLAGLTFGISYGAGMIIQSAKDGTLNRRDLYLISLFLVINHSLFEDTMLFVSMGANGFILVTFRFIASFLITWLASRYIFPIRSEGQPPQESIS